MICVLVRYIVNDEWWCLSVGGVYLLKMVSPEQKENVSDKINNLRMRTDL